MDKITIAARKGHQAGLKSLEGKSSANCNPYDQDSEEYFSWADAFQKALRIFRNETHD